MHCCLEKQNIKGKVEEKSNTSEIGWKRGMAVINDETEEIPAPWKTEHPIALR